MRLRNKTSHIHNLPEGTAPRRFLPTLMKYIYFMMLLSIIVGVCYLVALKYLYFSGIGQVETAKTILSSTHGGTVRTIDKEPGAKFSAGEVLAVIDRDRDCREQIPDIRLTRLAYEIKAKQSEYDIYAKQLGMLKKDYPSGMLPRALEIGDLALQRRTEDLQREYARLKEKILLLASEIVVKKQELAVLEVEMVPQKDITCDFETIEAPFDGTVYYITRVVDEYIDKAESLMVVVPEQAEVYIEGYFDRKFLRYIATGQTLQITFPDSTTSQGLVTGFSSSAQYSPETKRDNYVPVEAQLRVNLEPVKGEENYWRNYERMTVTIEGRRQ